MRLPDTWLETRLGEALNRVEAKVDPQTSAALSHFYVGLEHIESHTGRLLRGAEEVTEGVDILSIKTAYQKGDILYGKLRPNLNKVYLAEQDGICSTDIWALRASSEVLPEYALHYLRSPAVHIRASQLATGANLPRIPANSFDRILLPFPTLPEQQRIVDVLGEAQRLRELRRSADITSNSIKQALFLEMFGDPFSNPKRLRKAAIGKLIKFKSGAFLSAKDMAVDGNFKVYGGNGVNGFHDQYMFEERKIVLGRVGAYCGAVHYSEPKAWITDNALYVSEKLEYLDDHYLVAALELANLNRYAGQAGQPLISASRINPVEILVPDEADQKKFSKLVVALLELGGHRDKTEKQLDGLWKELIQQAFTGQLTETWREQHRAEIEAAAIERDTLMRERGAKLFIRTEVFTPPERPADFSRPTRYWLLNELSEFQGFVLDAMREWKGTLLADNASDLDDFCRLWPIEHERNMHDRAKRALEQLAALGLIAKVALPNDNGDFVTGYRQLRPEEKSRLNDISRLQASLESFSHEAGTAL